jgi:hypothetical protein
MQPRRSCRSAILAAVLLSTALVQKPEAAELMPPQGWDNGRIDDGR